MPSSDNINPLDTLIDQNTLLSVSFDKREVCKDLVAVFKERYPHLKSRYMFINPNLNSMVDFVFIFESNSPTEAGNTVNLYHIFIGYLYTTLGTNGFKVIRDSGSKKLLNIYFEEMFKLTANIPASRFNSLIEQMEYESYALQRPAYNPAIEPDIRGDYYVKNTKRIILDKGYSDTLDEKTMERVLKSWPEETTVTNWYYSERLTTDPKDEFYFGSLKCLSTFFRNITRLMAQFNNSREASKKRNQ